MGRKLREHPSLIFNLDREVHEALHANNPTVPLMSHYALMGTFNRFQPIHDPSKDIDALCFAIDRTVKGERFHRLERDLAGIAIESIQGQKPYIFEGMTR